MRSVAGRAPLLLQPNLFAGLKPVRRMYHSDTEWSDSEGEYGTENRGAID